MTAPTAHRAVNGPAPTPGPGARTTWTERLRDRIAGTVPPGQALPDRQPAYVASWVYVFGVATLAALVVVLVSGGILAVGGMAWWHTSGLGLFVNSLHLWSVEIFMAVMVIHLWGKFWMAAWRGGRAMTWVTGVVAFVGSIGTAFTGYLSQTNFDAQWISTQAKDGLNAVGIGAWFNVLNPGQMLSGTSCCCRARRGPRRHPHRPRAPPRRRAPDRRRGAPAVSTATLKRPSRSSTTPDSHGFPTDATTWSRSSSSRWSS